jgi:hypothetical protein
MIRVEFERSFDEDEGGDFPGFLEWYDTTESWMANRFPDYDNLFGSVYHRPIEQGKSRFYVSYFVGDVL